MTVSLGAMTLLTDHLRLGPVVFRGKTYSPEQLTGKIDSVARHLDATCKGRSPIVALFATNHVKTVAGYFGILKSGRVCLLADPACGALEWEEMIRDAPPSAVMRFDETTDVLDLDREVTLFDNVLDEEGQRELEGVCTLLFTAADDGYAKAAMLTHENMLAVGRTGEECCMLNESTAVCSITPMHHLFGLQAGLVMAALCMAPVCIIEPHRLMQPRSIVAELAATNVARLYSVPAALYMLAKAWAALGAPRPPTTITSGGVGLPQRLQQRYRQTLGCEIHEGYGLTEASPVCTWHRPYDQVRFGSVGRALTCCEVRIDSRDSQASPGADVGEVCVRGASVMKGYLRHAASTARALRDGWLHTGDLGRLDADGFLYLTGLKKQMLNVGGKKVYPAEVERLMSCHPRVKAVRIFGRPDALSGEAVCGSVRLFRSGPEAEGEFLGWCSRNLSAFKIPTRLRFA